VTEKMSNARSFKTEVSKQESLQKMTRQRVEIFKI
jgi:hypothetical protein